MEEITVIMPTYNKSKYLNLTLAGYCLQTHKDFSLIIVDDGSTDYTKNIIEEYNTKLSINYIYQKNAGRSAAKNTALNSVRSKYAIFSDDDRIPEPNFVREHLNALKVNENFITLGKKSRVLSFWYDDLEVRKDTIREVLEKSSQEINYVLNTEELITKEELLKSFNNTINKYSFGECLDNYSEVWCRYGKELENFYFGWAMATTGNMGLKMPVEKVFFDNCIVGWGGEDNDYAYQLHKKGMRFRYVESAINYHQYHTRRNEEMTQLRNNIKYMVKKYAAIEMKLFGEIFDKPYGVFTLIDANEQYINSCMLQDLQ